MKWPNFFESNNDDSNKESNPSQLSLDIKLTQKAVSAILTIFMGFMGAGAYNVILGSHANSDIKNNVFVNPDNPNNNVDINRSNFRSNLNYPNLRNEESNVRDTYSSYIIELNKELKKLENLLETHNCKFASTNNFEDQEVKLRNGESEFFYLFYLDLKRINKALVEENCSVLNTDLFQSNTDNLNHSKNNTKSSYSRSSSYRESHIFSTDILRLDSDLNFVLNTP